MCRSKVAQYSNQSLIKIEGVNTTKDAEFYFGKRVAYVYKVGVVKVVQIGCYVDTVLTVYRLRL